MMTIFFGGISFHVSLALLAYLLHIDMQWGATSKEKENSTFFEEVPRILKTFKWLYLFLLVLTGGMIYLGNFASCECPCVSVVPCLNSRRMRPPTVL